ncbi:MAG: response regulator transcription factor [Treponema sp.]|jgi:DNA-binding response OmpR family regulator|nr:response regulator transcription factor [Treponema sp.]
MKGKQTVLVVDDEPKILEVVKSYLEMNGFNALCAKNGREGMAFFDDQVTDLILLDLMLPDLSGEEFCKKVRQVSNIPIIMITAKVEEESIINGFTIGADDYVTKPFSPRQLMARVRAALRRNESQRIVNGTHSVGEFLSYRDLTIDTQNRIVRKKGEPLTLTRDEYTILSLFMSRQAKIFTRDEIIGAVKGDDFYGFDRSVDSHIKRLRARIGDDTKAPKYILTVYGMGYRLGEAQ